MQHPYIEITLNTGDPALAINRVLDGHEDMAIAAKPMKLPGQIAFTSVGYSPLVLIAPKIVCPISEKLSDNEQIDWSDLEFIVAEQGLSRQRLEQWWRKKYPWPNLCAGCWPRSHGFYGELRFRHCHGAQNCIG